MAATSRPDLVDVALLRPGRIDKSVYCGFPDEDERKEIIKVYLRKFQFSSTDPDSFEDFIDWLSRNTYGFTSADIKGLIQNAQLAKMSQLLKAHEQPSSQEIEEDGSPEEPDFRINEEDIRESLKTFVKGMSESERNRFLSIYAKYQDKGGN